MEYFLLDVFTTEKFGGNQLAVFTNQQKNEKLLPEQMQKIARELNLSESVFLMPATSSENDIKLRIFTPNIELDIAGHPTVGTAYFLAELGILQSENSGETIWKLEENIGTIPVKIIKKDSKIVNVEMSQPLPSIGEEFKDTNVITQLLTIEETDIDNSLPIISMSAGVPFIYIPLNSVDAIKKIQFRQDIWEKYFKITDDFKHIFTFTTNTGELPTDVYSRMFAPAMGISEDPATGAASGPLGVYLTKYYFNNSIPNTSQSIVSLQGVDIGRPSRISINVGKNDQEITSVSIAGTSVIMGKGQLFL